MNASNTSQYTSKLDKYAVLDTVFKLDLQKSKDKEYMFVKIISTFWTVVHLVHFFSTCQARKAWFELSRVNLYRNDLKGNKNYFELAGGSSYRGFELPSVKL